MADYVGHVCTRRSDLSAVAICDKEYPRRVSFAVLDRCLDDFVQKVPRERWSQSISFPELKEIFNKYQNPAEADQLLKVQRELDETKIIMVRHQRR